MQIVEGGVCVATKLLLGLRYVQRRKFFFEQIIWVLKITLTNP